MPTYQEIMAEWDREVGITAEARAASLWTYEDAAQDAANPGWNSAEEWIAALEAGDVAAIVAGRKAWGLPIFV